MATLQSDTRTVRIDADVRTVFEFLSDPSNLPGHAGARVERQVNDLIAELGVLKRLLEGGEKQE